MAQGSDFLSPTRRGFLATTGGALAGAVAGATPLAAAAAPQDSNSSAPVTPRKKIPIGVFDPAFPDLTTDQLVEKYASLGAEAIEVGTGGYPNDKHCPVQELLDDPAKLKAWRKKFDDRNIQIAVLSCHGNPVHPDRNIADRDAQTFRRKRQQHRRDARHQTGRKRDALSHSCAALVSAAWRSAPWGPQTGEDATFVRQKTKPACISAGGLHQ